MRTPMETLLQYVYRINFYKKRKLSVATLMERVKSVVLQINEWQPKEEPITWKVKQVFKFSESRFHLEQKKTQNFIFISQLHVKNCQLTQLWKNAIKSFWANILFRIRSTLHKQKIRQYLISIARNKKQHSTIE